MELTLTGEFMDAQTAFKYGLVSHVYTPELLLEEAIKLADKISTFSKYDQYNIIRPIVASVKESINQAENSGLREGIRYEKSYSMPHSQLKIEKKE